jgi:hypothetical protein
MVMVAFEPEQVCGVDVVGATEGVTTKVIVA